MDNFERLVFFGDGRNRPEMPSCNYCHTVTQPPGNATPIVAQTVSWGDFFQHARFDHSEHLQMNCVDCHDAEEGRVTSELMMPSVKSCAQCHSPKGFAAKSGAPHECASCHQYHAPAPLKNLSDARRVRDFLRTP